MRYHGSCHCGRIAFDVEGEITQAIACNCSMCSRKGSLLWFVPRSQFHLQSSDEAMASYTFNKHRIQHVFCKTCGIHPFCLGADRQGNEMAAINLRALEGIDLDSIPVQHVDGRAL